MDSPSPTIERGSEGQHDQPTDDSTQENPTRLRPPACLSASLHQGVPGWTAAKQAEWVASEESADYMMQLDMIAEQCKRRLSIINHVKEEADAPLRTIASLRDHLNIAHTSAKELLELFSAYYQTTSAIRNAG
jgi:hypothetical protein